MSFRDLVRVTYNLTLWPIALLLRLAPRSPTRWVFGGAGAQRFADNSAWLYLWVLQNRPDIRATWVTRSGDVLRRLRSAGLPARREWSPAGLWAQVRAGVVVLSHGQGDVYYPAACTAYVVNLWHGLPIKHIMLDHPSDRAIMRPRTFLGRLAQGLRRPGLQKGPDLLLAMSPAGRRRMEQCAGLPPARTSDAGFPRLQALTPATPRWPFPEDLQTLAGLRQGREFVVLLMPTWGTKASVWAELLGAPLRKWLADNDAVLVVKAHPNDVALAIDDPDRLIRTAPTSLDATLLIAQADVLVTDISSAMVDMLSAGRPVVLTPTVWGRDERGRYQDPEQLVTMPPVLDAASFVRALTKARALRRAGRSDASPAAKPWLGVDLAASCPRVVSEIEGRRSA